MTPTEFLLPKLRADLGITTEAFADRLTDYLKTAGEEIRREGAVLGSASDDDDLVVMYAAWRWRRRATGEEMPRMLRYALNNKIFSQKMGGA